MAFPHSRRLHRYVLAGVTAMASLSLTQLTLPPAARAESASAAPLYRASGAAAGSVAGSVSADGTTTEFAITLQALSPNTIYVVSDCLPAPLQEAVSICASSFASGTLTTDAAGNATGTLSFSVAAPVNIITVTAADDPTDTAQTVVWLNVVTPDVG